MRFTTLVAHLPPHRLSFCALLRHLVAGALLFGALGVSAPAHADGSLRILVLEPTSEQVEKQTLKTIAQLISVELQNIQGFDVITRDDVKKMMELEAEKQASGCDDSSCLAELAGAMGAELVVFGDVGKLGSVMIITFNLFDSTAAKSTNRVNMKVKGLEEIPDKIPDVMRRLLAGVGGQSATSTAESRNSTSNPEKSVAPQAGAKDSKDSAINEPAKDAKTEATTNDKQVGQVKPQPAQTSALAGVWRWGLVATGATVVAAGFAFDAVSSTSGDGYLGPADFSWVYASVVGGGLAALGFIWNPFATSEDKGGDDA